LIVGHGKANELDALRTLEGEGQRKWHTKSQAAAPKTEEIVPVSDME